MIAYSCFTGEVQKALKYINEGGPVFKQFYSLYK
jgi:hypothetical protein